MANLFFGKMNDPKQVEDKVYKTSDKGFFGDMQPDDYVFIKLEKETHPATVKRLWKLKDISEVQGEEYTYTASFDEVFQFEPIPLLQFEALDLFVLDMNLLNKCNKQTKRLSFYLLSQTDEAIVEKLVNSQQDFADYVSNDSHYRKMVKCDSKDSAVQDTIDVQFYQEGDSWMLADAAFIGDDLKDNYDSSQFDLFEKYGNKGSNSAKDKMYQFLAGYDVDVPMMGLWDLFCGTVSENAGSKKAKKTSNKRDEFIEYCKENGVVRAAGQYESGIRSMESKLSVNIDDEFDRDECENLLQTIDNHIQKTDESQLGAMRNWPHHVKKYVEYKKSIGSIALGSEEEASGYTTYDYSLAKHSGYNKVYYGTPGCGKSYYVENEVLAQEEIDDNSVFRTTFFHDYTNTDFVGQVLPRVDADGNVSYEFNPGPFTLALKCAIDNPDEKVALIIEELNRGNAPSIFGDIFQLLDRKDGTSSYSIVNVNIQSYLQKESAYDLEYIKIPSNLFIFATMNTSDQNVFTLDAAFRRRWKYKKISNIFRPEDTIGVKYVPGLKEVKWKVFVETINDFIISHATSLSAEDKQLGKYFVEEDYLMENPDDFTAEMINDFVYKVFVHLWTDVAKFNREDWFAEEIKTLDKLIYKYEHFENIFAPGLASKLPVYVPVEEEE